LAISTTVQNYVQCLVNMATLYEMVILFCTCVCTMGILIFNALVYMYIIGNIDKKYISNLTFIFFTCVKYVLILKICILKKKKEKEKMFKKYI